jgi:hypothetical protein
MERESEVLCIGDVNRGMFRLDLLCSFWARLVLGLAQLLSSTDAGSKNVLKYLFF